MRHSPSRKNSMKPLPSRKNSMPSTTSLDNRKKTRRSSVCLMLTTLRQWSWSLCRRVSWFLFTVMCKPLRMMHWVRLWHLPMPRQASAEHWKADVGTIRHLQRWNSPRSSSASWTNSTRMATSWLTAKRVQSCRSMTV